MSTKIEKEIQDFMEKLGKEGYAVAVFTPNEIGDADIDELENLMISRGWEYIESQE